MIMEITYRDYADLRELLRGRPPGQVVNWMGAELLVAYGRLVLEHIESSKPGWVKEAKHDDRRTSVA